MTLKIYFDPLSQPSRAILLLCRLNGIAYEGIPIQIREGENKSDEFSKINPIQKLPVIDHDGFILTESVAILRYICRTFPVAGNWYPANSQVMARVDEYMAWQHLNLRSNCALFFMTHFIPVMLAGKIPDSSKVSRCRRGVDTSLDQIENIWLKDKAFITGKDITIADLLAVSEMEQPGMVGYDVSEGRPVLAAYRNRVKSRLSSHYNEIHSTVYEMTETYNKEFSSLKSKM